MIRLLRSSSSCSIHRALFSRAYSSSSDPSPEAIRNAEKMLNLMASSPQMQSMMMSMLPPAARNAETVKQLLNDPGMKSKLVQMLASQKMHIPSHVLEGMTPGHMEETFERAARMGVDPKQLFVKLVSHPELLKKLQEPQILAAFMDLSRNPQNVDKYRNDGETMDVIRQVRAALGMDNSGFNAQPGGAGDSAGAQQQVIYRKPDTSRPSDGGPATGVVDAAFAESTSGIYQADGAGSSAAEKKEAASSSPSSSSPPPPPGSPPSSSAAPSSSTSSIFGAFKLGGGGAPSTSAPPQPGGDGGVPPGVGGLPPNIMVLLMSDPELMKRLQNPKVQAALAEISKSPWKTIKYVFDREVMDVFSALNNLMRGKDPWSGKKKETPPPPPPTPV